MDSSLVHIDDTAVIITGAGAGLGAAHARALAAAGARLVLNDVPGSAVGDLATELGAVAVEGDVSDMKIGQDLVDAALEAYGRLDALVNNAGVLRDRMIFNMAEEEWDAVMRVHLKGHFSTTRAATAHWRERSKTEGGPVGASIINTASEAFLLGSGGQPNYAAAKGGIAALTTATAASCGRYGIRANAICPQARTAMTAQLMGPAPEGPDAMAAGHVSPLVAYLVSPASQHVNGQVFIVRGGVIGVLDPPPVSQVLHAEGGGFWETPDQVARAFEGVDLPPTGFRSDEYLKLS